MTNPHNEKSIFPELNLEVFQNLTQEWFQNYPVIKKITLHRFKSKYEKYLRGNINTRYAVTFFLFDDVDPAKKRKRWLCPAIRVVLEDALGYFETVQSPDEKYRAFLVESYTPGLYGGEKNVPKNFRNHWYFSVVGNDDELKFIPCDLNDPHWKFILEDMKPKDEFIEQEKLISSSREFDIENFVKNLVIGYENDNEISIKEPRKTEKLYTANTLGFRNNADKGWKTFISILQSHEKTYNIGKAGEEKFKNKQYDSNRKRLIEINKKILKFIMNEFSLVLPQKFKIYERVKNEKPGTYRFKFQIKDEKTANIDHPDPMLNKMSNKDLLKKIKSTKCAYDESTDENEKNKLREDLSNLTLHACDKADIPRDKIDALFKRSKIRK